MCCRAVPWVLIFLNGVVTQLYVVRTIDWYLVRTRSAPGLWFPAPTPASQGESQEAVIITERLR